ncbi:MAG: hypothetical protein WC756_21655 [Taibaiella sp.]|jgi:hypothetical protein
MKIEKGVMIVKDGKAWGEVYSGGNAKLYGWVDIESAPIHDPEHCKIPSDATYPGSPYIDELMTGNIVLVERVTNVYIK